MQCNSASIIYHKDVMEFAQVAIQYCAHLEQAYDSDKNTFCDTMLKLLPLLYLKGQMLPSIEGDESFVPDGKVTEEDYNYIRSNVYGLLENDDEYLTVAYEELMQTDETQWRSVSEHLADAYQPIRNFLAVYEDGIESCVTDALWGLRNEFELHWGQCLADAMQRLHFIKYGMRS